jgi:hypothetical protein
MERGARFRRARGAAATLVVAVALAGCGDPSTQDYKTEYQKAAQEFKQSVDQAGRQVPKGSGLKGRLPALKSFKDSINRLAIKLDGFAPPNDVKKLNDQAVTGLRTLASDLGKFEAAAKKGDRAAASKLTPKLQTDQAQLQTVLDQIDQKLSG